MKVSGTPYDQVEWDVSPFGPGKIFWHPPAEDLRPLQTNPSPVALRVPCRLDPVVLDYAKLHPTSETNDYKAGAVGFAADLYSEVTVNPIQDPVIKASGSYPLIAEHIATIIKRITGYDGGFEINCSSHGLAHVGFSSTSSLSSAVANATNIGLGCPFSERLLVKVVAHNYAEISEHYPGLLTPGISTGSSGWIAQVGGIVVVASDCELVLRQPIPEGTTIIGAIPPVESAGKGPETSEVDVHSLSWVRHIDRFNAAKVCYWILMDFMPAMIQGDLQTMGSILYDIMFCGSKGAPLSPMHGGNILSVIFAQRKAGVEVCFMSSAGPGVVAMTRDKSPIATRIFEDNGYQVVMMQPDNVGAIVM